MELFESRYLATRVAVGWVLFLLVKVFAFSSAILFSIYANDGHQALFLEPGPDAARAARYVFGLVSIVPIYVFVVAGVRSSWWRWPVVLMGTALLLVSLLHHWGHWAHGELGGPGAHIVHLMATGAAAWLVYSAIAWARHRSVG
jgi:hypothetical protein